MAQSKTNKKREHKLQNYKDSLKAKTKKQMSQSKPLPQVQQRPIWNSNADIVLKGFEYEALVNVVNIFRDALQAAESSLQRNVEAGKITVKYYDENNVELTPEQVTEIMAVYRSRFQELAQKEGGQLGTPPDSPSDEKPKSLLVSETGEALISESPLRAV